LSSGHLKLDRCLEISGSNFAGTCLVIQALGDLSAYRYNLEMNYSFGLKHVPFSSFRL
jgi:hypothetical protein